MFTSLQCTVLSSGSSSLQGYARPNGVSLSIVSYRDHLNLQTAHESACSRTYGAFGLCRYLSFVFDFESNIYAVYSMRALSSRQIVLSTQHQYTQCPS